MLSKANKCPKCNGTLLFECVGNYGDVFRVSKRTGKPGKERIRRAHYEYGDYMLYCTLCGTNFDFRFDRDGSLLLDFDEEVRDA